MNLQQALDHWDKHHRPNEPFMRPFVEAARSVVEGTDTPDYKAARDMALSRGWIEREWIDLVIDAAVKGRRLVEWEDTSG